MNSHSVKSESIAPYSRHEAKVEGDNAIVKNAIDILHRRLRRPGRALTSPTDTFDYLRLRLSEYQHEMFCCLYLDNRHQLIEFQEMFRGTIDGASVHPREVVKEALRLNAAALIFAHNHPSGVCEPSHADGLITKRLKDALALVDIRVLDHVIVGGPDTYSFAQQGEL